MTKVIRTIEELKQFRKSVSTKSVGFVPTMGALHTGHETLLQRARNENDIVILSIFVNPTQFNDKNDYTNYPRTDDQDILTAERNHVDVVFMPEYSSLYPDNYTYKISETSLSLDLCGAHRPGHFDGVLSVVLKLLMITKPDRSYFGEKDFQQLQLIEGMVNAFFIDTMIVRVPTVRESSGLALSSRNKRLTPTEKEIAPLIYKTITQVKKAEEAQQILENNGFHVEYVVDKANRRFIAAKLGHIRLIDNVQI